MKHLKEILGDISSIALILLGLLYLKDINIHGSLFELVKIYCASLFIYCGLSTLKILK